MKRLKVVIAWGVLLPIMTGLLWLCFLGMFLLSKALGTPDIDQGINRLSQDWLLITVAFVAIAILPTYLITHWGQLEKSNNGRYRR